MGIDIIFSEKQKQLLNMGVWLLRKKLGKVASREAIEEEMAHCSNDAIRMISEIISNQADKVVPDWQKNVMKDYSNLFLWILLHDTAYRNPAFATLDELLKPKNAKKLRQLIKPYVLPPEEWYCNVWWKHRNKTFDKRKKGEIPFYDYDYVDKQCVPALHQADLNYQLKKLKKGK